VTIYGYCRVSTVGQIDGLSLEQQRQEIIAYCVRFALPEPQILADEGVSGMKTQERHDYQRLLGLCREGDTVVVYDLSRLSRRAKEVLSALDLFRERKVRFISIRQQLDSSSVAGGLVFGILAVVNEMLVMEARQRTQAAIDYLKANGRKTGGTIPFGFDAVPDGIGLKLVANKTEYDTIVLVTRLRGEGMSLRSIARLLQAEGIRSKTGGNWHASTVRKLLARAADRQARSDVHDGRKHDVS
jgi:DNA invertase Pin-like site-specific DNA recombinase